jgi:multidrug efflux pump subunit AcrB
MDPIKAALRNPVAVAAAVALLALFGALALLRLPLQLFPDVERPQMSVVTDWRAASPQEVEAEILEPMEDVLMGLPGLEQFEGAAQPGASWVNLTFAVGTDLKDAMVEVIGRLNRMPPLPADANPPVVSLNAQDPNQTLIYYFVQLLPGTAGTIDEQHQFVLDAIKPRIEAVDGVASVEVNGTTPEQLQIDIDLQRAAQYGIALPAVAALAGRSRDVSGGFRDVGRRQYTLRLGGRYDAAELSSMILAWRDGRPVTLGDIASVAMVRPERSFMSWQNGNPAIGLRLMRESGANVLGTLDEVQRVVDALRAGPLAERGLGIERSFDPGLFIRRAVALLGGNLGAGVLLAVGCLWWFLRDARATALIASAIPISLLGTFIVLGLAGRSLNVVSLAGLAFAVGMVMDAAIVVAENIVRLKEAGRAPLLAAEQGTREVAGALFASTVTTIAVFLPVMFLRDVEGQVFADLALTVSIAVAISLVVALTVLPAAAGGWLRGAAVAGQATGFPRLTRWVMDATRTPARQLGWLAALVVAPLAGAAALLPPIDYLPPVKRAAIDAFLSTPPGMSPEAVDREIGARVRERMAPYMDGSLQPQLKNWYVMFWPGGGTVGVRVEDETRIGEMERIVREQVLAGLPDTRAFVSEGQLFGGFGGSARAVAIHLQSGDTAALNRVAEQGRAMLVQRFAGANVQVFPPTEAATPELRFLPDDRRLAEVGWSREQLGTVVRALGDGAWLGEYFDGDRRMDVILRGGGWRTPEEIGALPLATGDGGVVPVGELARIEVMPAAGQLRRVDGRRTVTLTFDPPASLSLEDALAALEDDVLPMLRASLPSDGAVRMAGSADRLDGLLASMGGNLVLALLVLFMLMAAMFRSLVDSAFVMLTLPLALFGGVLGLRVLDVFAPQPLDLLSMIGFVMLLGMVINNGILLVSQARAAQAAGETLDRAVAQALDQRMRPILIGALTGVVGALPLAVSPGPGAVIYRGLAAVTVGGVGLSLVFTAVMVPAALRLAGTWRRRRIAAGGPSLFDAP